MAVTIDIGEVDNIHPKNKQEVGKRLALVALAKVYERLVVYSGPEYDSFAIEDGNVRVKFKAPPPSKELPGGLEAKGGELKGFLIAGDDKKLVPAKAKIDGQTVVVWSESVAKPVAVRYAWEANPACNLYNKEGLPAAPFRTDNWP
jgi:sialate O-acetylesterase